MTLLGIANLIDPLKVVYQIIDEETMLIDHQKVDELLQEANETYSFELCDIMRLMLM